MTYFLNFRIPPYLGIGEARNYKFGTININHVITKKCKIRSKYRLIIKGTNEKCAKLGQKRGEVNTLFYLLLEFRDPTTSLERLKLLQISLQKRTDRVEIS